MKYNTQSFSLDYKSEPFIFDVDSLFYHLDFLTDRRKPKGVRYPLSTALCFVILAKLAGQDTPRAMADWMEFRKDFLIQALKLKRNATPHYTTLSRILGRAVEVNQLQQVFTEFLLSTTETVCIEIPVDFATALLFAAAYLASPIERCYH